jgi:aldehyde dehydrogenase (NAD+)
MDIFGQLQHFFLSGNTKTFQHRQAALNSLKKTLLKSKQEILQAAKKDFSRSEAEVFAAELAKIFQEIDFTLKHLRTWLKPQKTYSSCFGLRSKGYIYHEPYGVVLIIASWNFPFLLSLVPLIHALAAGNCAIVKPSELAPAQAAVIENIIKKSFNSSFVSVVQGDAQITQQLLTFPFDYIFFTGSSKVGALVYQKAAQQLIPVTLELGGKNPTIVTQDTDISYAAQKIAWGKFYAAGQCCLAPDYVLVDESVKEQFINFLKKYVLDFYGPDPAHNNGYTHIVTTQHINR